jgi:hypothetical protein
MLLLNFSPCFGFCWEKCAEKVLFDDGLPIFSVRIVCLIGMYLSMIWMLALHSAIEKKTWGFEEMLRV